MDKVTSRVSSVTSLSVLCLLLLLLKYKRSGLRFLCLIQVVIEHDRMHSFYLNQRLIDLDQCLNIFGFIGFQFPCFSWQTDNYGGYSENWTTWIDSDVLRFGFSGLESATFEICDNFEWIRVLLRANIGILLSPSGATWIVFPKVRELFWFFGQSRWIWATIDTVGQEFNHHILCFIFIFFNFLYCFGQWNWTIANHTPNLLVLWLEGSVWGYPSGAQVAWP